MALINVLLAILVALSAVLFYRLFPFVIRPFFSPLRELPGPPNPSWLFGHFRRKFTTENLIKQEQWIKEYGNVVLSYGMFGTPRLYTHDPKVINHVLIHSMDYSKPAFSRFILSRLLGDGVLITEGEKHRQQRRVMNPAFGPAQVREITSIFLDKTRELRDIWLSSLSPDGEPTRIDVLPGLSRMALDVIGLAGFKYEFNALNADPSHPNELNTAFRTIFQQSEYPLFSMLRVVLPPLRLIPTERSRRVAEAMETMRRIGMQLIAEKQAGVLSESSEKVEKKDVQGRDLLSLLVKSNMATDIPENRRLSDEDILAQIPTFIIAGHETTATAVTWCLFALTQAPHVQAQLREELLSTSETPSMDDLMALPYLDKVVRETLRLHSPIPQTIRVAAKDDVISVATPYKDKNGVEKDYIRVSRGDLVIIPIVAMNRDQRIWGEDSLEFKPDRWNHLPESVSTIPGVWGHLMSFIGGPRACIGYRFALVEMKALLFGLIRAFEFELAVSPEDVVKSTSIVQRPLVLGEVEKGSQMPLLVKEYRPA